MAAPIVSFVIPVRDDAERLQRCLMSITAHTGGTPIEIIVADNGSTDGSAAIARDAGATVLDLPKRPVSEVRNLAAKTARGELLAFVDADHVLAPGWIAAAVRRLGDKDISAAGAEYDAPSGGTWVQRMYDTFRQHQTGVHPTDWLPSGNLVVRRSAFEKAGGFDEGLESCEDVDFCRRIRQSGGVLVSDASLRSVHVGDPRTLAALFFSELWRGRDNLRVSLRDRLTLRSAPSIVIPIVDLAALLLAVVASGLPKPIGWRLLIGSLALFLGLAVLRASRMYSRISRGNRRLVDPLQAFVVAATYDLARALALVARAGHNLRRRG